MHRVFSILLGLAGSVTFAGAADASKPNLLFIFADDMGWQDTSVAFAEERTKFNDRFHTPALERLAREGAGLDETEAAYASLLDGMDKSVGDLLALLDELGIAENTLVVFTSDNGAVSHHYRTMDPPHTHNNPLSSGKGAHHEGGRGRTKRHTEDPTRPS